MSLWSLQMMFLAEVWSGQQCTSVVYGEMQLLTLQHECSCTVYCQHKHQNDAEVLGLQCMLHFRDAGLRMGPTMDDLPE